MTVKACSRCGRVALPGTNRCALHYRKHRSGSYIRDARRIVETATRCHLCGEGPRAGDPFVCDHIIPRMYGGSDDPSNLAPAHRSCNGRRGANLGNGHDPRAQPLERRWTAQGKGGCSRS